jgi:transposase-like protein
VVGIFPNEASITRLIDAVLLEQNDEWQLQCRCRLSHYRAFQNGTIA